LAASRRRRRNRRAFARVRLVVFVCALVLLVFTVSQLSAAERGTDRRAVAKARAEQQSTANGAGTAEASDEDAVHGPPVPVAPLQELPRLRQPGEAPAPRRAARTTPTTAAAAVKAKAVEPEVTESKVAEPKADVPAPVTTPVERDRAATPTVAAPRALPFTGEQSLTPLVAGGSLLVLLGMLAQIAGQPVPARAAARHDG
jgi:cytoskeletal protein RodZ